MALVIQHLVLVHRDEFRVEWWRKTLGSQFKKYRTYRCAVGKLGYETPAGVYLIFAKSKDPSWTPPDSDWVPAEWKGRTFPAGSPENPLRGAFLSLTDGGVGLHGTADLSSLGSAASHGCIRMDPKDVLRLYEKLPMFTPVVII